MQEIKIEILKKMEKTGYLQNFKKGGKEFNVELYYSFQKYLYCLI